jgi:acetyl-CoA acetyltransferase
MGDVVQDAAITGIGMSALGRNTGRACIDLLADAALEAMADAGLTRDDIDGITTYPGKHDNSPGMSPLGCTEVREALGLKTRWHSSSSEGPAQMSPIMIAAMAVATGQARHVLWTPGQCADDRGTRGQRLAAMAPADGRGRRGHLGGAVRAAPGA